MGCVEFSPHFPKVPRLPLLLTPAGCLALLRVHTPYVCHSGLLSGYLLTVSQPANSKYTPAQLEWLRAKFVEFLHHQVNKTTSQFFPPLYEEYFSTWPPTPTKEDINEAGGEVAVATAASRQIEERVRDIWLVMLICGELTTIMNNSGSTAGCITVLARSMVSVVKVPLQT